MPNRLKNRVFVVLATLLVAMIPLIAVAQSPDDCDLRDRMVPGDNRTPCRPETMDVGLDLEYVFNPVSGEVWEGPGAWYCEYRQVFTLSVSPSRPEDLVIGSLITDLRRTRGYHVISPGYDWTNTENGAVFDHQVVVTSLGTYYEHGTQGHAYRHLGFRDGKPVQYKVLAHLGGSYEKYGIRLDSDWIRVPMPETTHIGDKLDSCIVELALSYENAVRRADELERERKIKQAEELKELKSQSELEIAKEIETISARIDALRLRVAKQIDVNVVELNLVRERTTKAAIEIDREITAIEIDTKRKYMQSLEDTARWINEWVLEKQDQWDDLAELQSQWKQRITEYQTETAQVIQDLEAKRAEIESSIAESERRQRELEAQIRDSQIDTSQLEAQLEAAQAELKAAQERLEELED